MYCIEESESESEFVFAQLIWTRSWTGAIKGRPENPLLCPDFPFAIDRRLRGPVLGSRL